MKALGHKVMTERIKIETQKYLQDEYDKLVYAAMIKQMPEYVKQTEAMILWYLSKNGWGKKRLQWLHSGFVSLTKMSEVLGKVPQAKDCMKYLTDNYGIDFNEVNPNMESFEEFCNDTR